jgi:hypothetical protein
MNVTGVILALVALVVVAVMGYRAGYLRGRAELLLQIVPTEAEWNELRMNSVLPRWRRMAGWAGLRVRRAVALSFPGLRVSVCHGLGVELFVDGLGSLVRPPPGRDRARRVVLEAPPRGPRRHAVRRLWNDRRHLRPAVQRPPSYAAGQM